MSQQPFMTLHDIANRLQVSYQYVWKQWSKGSFPNGILLGTEVRVPPADLDAYVKALRTKTASKRGLTAS